MHVQVFMLSRKEVLGYETMARIFKVRVCMCALNYFVSSAVSVRMNPVAFGLARWVVSVNRFRFDDDSFYPRPIPSPTQAGFSRVPVYSHDHQGR